MVSTIQVSKDLMEALKSRKMYDKESYEDIIWDLLEDTMQLSGETEKNIRISQQQINKGKTYGIREVRKRLKLDV